MSRNTSIVKNRNSNEEWNRIDSGPLRWRSGNLPWARFVRKQQHPMHSEQITIRKSAPQDHWKIVINMRFSRVTNGLRNSRKATRGNEEHREALRSTFLAKIGKSSTP
jgi:hypothetical protein